MLSGIVTIALLLIFLAGWWWAWSPRRRGDFDAAAQLPLQDQHEPAQDMRKEKQP
ncbi:cbb3-type cytochrome oxidase subunit 3 [Lysobacter niastensis]|uniref:CcoQ/FixQ family Cbb3-type cytochrome c oxidase assembly chaperone n=1 Tax=Lysobacter niastensis TaxID=380629 RepID=A0ABS0B884_9GAMM|nr:cbb3-type cytochrome c oxidase subunit 3 [Lysobacter niastensis]MBF6025205.1 CcoQ/FixQ family Cbb3-type cytochrome c oxidase assembly chaperone [Lysobacter niastensis]